MSSYSSGFIIKLKSNGLKLGAVKIGMLLKVGDINKLFLKFHLLDRDAEKKNKILSSCIHGNFIPVASTFDFHAI